MNQLVKHIIQKNIELDEYNASFRKNTTIVQIDQEMYSHVEVITAPSRN